MSARLENDQSSLGSAVQILHETIKVEVKVLGIKVTVTPEIGEARFLERVKYGILVYKGSVYLRSQMPYSCNYVMGEPSGGADVASICVQQLFEYHHADPLSRGAVHHLKAKSPVLLYGNGVFAQDQLQTGPAKSGDPVKQRVIVIDSAVLPDEKLQHMAFISVSPLKS